MACITRSACFVGTPLSAKSAGVRPARLARATVRVKASDDFDLFKLAGGRGIGAGEKSLKTDEGKAELWKDDARPMPEKKELPKAKKNFAEGEEDIYVGQGRYVKGDSKKLPKKEDLGFFIGATGGFAGGEELLWQFREEIKGEQAAQKLAQAKAISAKEAPTMRAPVLMPGMNALVVDKQSPYHQFTGIVQRVTDGKAMLIFEGGNWDKSVTFPLEQLERSAAGPPALNPKSAAIMERVALLEEANKVNKDMAVESSGL